MKEKDYVLQLRELVHQINSTFGPLARLTKKNLNEAARWDPPEMQKEEKELLTYLIDRGREYIQLRKIASRHFIPKKLFEEYFSLSRWFTSLQMLLDTFDVPLYKVSFNDMALKQ
jgi:hypothetical protein